jgi:phage-related protein
MPRDRKPVRWVGRAYEELVSFPAEAMRQAGNGLRLVQQGEEPGDWKPMEAVGPGAREIRVRTHEGGTVQHRVVFVAKFEEAVYVLHAFEKKTQTTSQHHIDVARARYTQLLRSREQGTRPKKGR